MKKLSTCLLYFIPLLGVAQQLDRYQSDSVFKQNKVKARIMSFSGGTKARIICKYDKSGRLSEWTLTDNETGKIPQLNILYTFDTYGRQFSEIEINENEKVTTTFEYDSLGRVKKKVSTFPGGKLKEQTEYEFEPLTTTNFLFDEQGEIYRKQTSVYDNKNLLVRFFGFDKRDTTSQKRWNYLTENHVDLNGRLITAKETSNGKIIMEYEYIYNKKGLLIKMITVHGSVGGFRSEEEFKYKFW